MSNPFQPAAAGAALEGEARRMAEANPSVEPPKAPSRRIPLGLPTLKLQVPEIPGYLCHWFRGNPGRIQQALQGGYEFVKRGEVEINSYGLANSYDDDGNSDLGSNVSRAAESGERLVLMKIRRELALEDKQAYLDQQEAVASQIRGEHGIPMAGGDNSNRYSKSDKTQTNLFTPRQRRL